MGRRRGGEAALLQGPRLVFGGRWRQPIMVRHYYPVMRHARKMWLVSPPPVSGSRRFAALGHLARQMPGEQAQGSSGRVQAMVLCFARGCDNMVVRCRSSHTFLAGRCWRLKWRKLCWLDSRCLRLACLGWKPSMGNTQLVCISQPY